MSDGYHIVVCAGIIPDPLQTLEPITNASGPGLKNEMMLPAVLDPWASHALYEASNLASHTPGSKVWLVSAAPKAKLQQVMMNVAQKANFELVPIDAPANGFADAHAVAALLANAVQEIPDLDRSRLLLFGGWNPPRAVLASPCNWLANNSGLAISFKESTRSQFSPTARLKFLSESKVDGTWSQFVRDLRSCLAGRPDTCQSRETIHKSGWRICAPSFPHCRRQNLQLWHRMCNTSA